jgi:hypothetical protein
MESRQFINHFDGYVTIFNVFNDNHKQCMIGFDETSKLQFLNHHRCSLYFCIPYTRELDMALFENAMNRFMEILANLPKNENNDSQWRYISSTNDVIFVDKEGVSDNAGNLHPLAIGCHLELDPKMCEISGMMTDIKESEVLAEYMKLYIIEKRWTLQNQVQTLLSTRKY